MQAQPSPVLERARVEALSARQLEPRWLAERRLEALELANQTPYPRWERTDLSGLDLDRLLREACGPNGTPREPQATAPAPAVAPDLDDTEWLGEVDLPPAFREAVSRRDGAAVLLVVATREGGFRTVARVDPGLARQGVAVLSLQRAVQRHEAVVQRHLMTRVAPPSTGKFAALNGALWDAGALVYVPDGVRVEEPVEVILWAEGGRRAVFPRTLVVLGEQARLRLVETWGSSPANEPMLVAGVVELVAGPASHLEYAPIQRWGPQALAFTHRRAVLERDSRLEWVVAEFGARLTRGEFDTALEGPGSQSQSIMVFFAGKDQHMDFVNTMVHRGTHTDSDIVARGVLSGQARGVYGAITHIHRGARASGSWQKGNILVLSQDARADANPSVVVEESEVQRAGHAATVGKVDPEQLFYLMSRGIPERTAIRLIVEGFLQPVLERVPIASVREQVIRLVNERLEGAG